MTPDKYAIILDELDAMDAELLHALELEELPHIKLNKGLNKMKHVLGIDLGTQIGISCLFIDGNERTYTRKLESNLAGRVRGVAAIIRQHATPECMGVVIEQPFGAHASALQALYAMMGAAVLACEENGLPWSLVHLSKIKSHATGKGNAKKPEMQAAAKARWGRDFTGDEADALWCAAYGMDSDLFK